MTQLNDQSGFYNFEAQLLRIESKVDDLHTMIYKGNGRPSLMTRMDRLEGYVDDRRKVENWIARAIVVALVGIGFSGIALILTATQTLP